MKTNNQIDFVKDQDCHFKNASLNFEEKLKFLLLAVQAGVDGTVSEISLDILELIRDLALLIKTDKAFASNKLNSQVIFDYERSDPLGNPLSYLRGGERKILYVEAIQQLGDFLSRLLTGIIDSIRVFLVKGKDSENSLQYYSRMLNELTGLVIDSPKDFCSQISRTKNHYDQLLAQNADLVAKIKRQKKRIKALEIGGKILDLSRKKLLKSTPLSKTPENFSD